MPTTRPDCAAAISKLARALTFPTPELDACADRVIVYLYQTRTEGLLFDGKTSDAATLVAYSDSDWAVSHSTSGYAIFLSGAAVTHSSRRQKCIACSSTEAEIIAASEAAKEVVYFRRLCSELGLEQDEPTVLYVDNSGAVALAKDKKSSENSRHVARRYFKVRELQAEGEIVTIFCPTADNAADILTKPLEPKAHEKHKATCLGTRTLANCVAFALCTLANISYAVHTRGGKSTRSAGKRPTPYSKRASSSSVPPPGGGEGGGSSEDVNGPPLPPPSPDPVPPNNLPFLMTAHLDMQTVPETNIARSWFQHTLRAIYDAMDAGCETAVFEVLPLFFEGDTLLPRGTCWSRVMAIIDQLERPSSDVYITALKYALARLDRECHRMGDPWVLIELLLQIGTRYAAWELSDRERVARIELVK